MVSGNLDVTLSRIDSLWVWVERATGPLWWATRPPRLVRPERTICFTRWWCRSSAASCRRGRPSWPFHPDPIESFRPSVAAATAPHTVTVLTRRGDESEQSAGLGTGGGRAQKCRIGVRRSICVGGYLCQAAPKSIAVAITRKMNVNIGAASSFLRGYGD
jgi:hypothetical protein